MHQAHGGSTTLAVFFVRYRYQLGFNDAANTRHADQALELGHNGPEPRISDMATATIDQRTTYNTEAFGLTAITARLKAAVARNRVYRQTQRELSLLNDRDLADLGIARGMINEIARNAARAV